jgi:hypothetical protein
LWTVAGTQIFNSQDWCSCGSSVSKRDQSGLLKGLVEQIIKR